MSRKSKRRMVNRNANPEDMTKILADKIETDNEAAVNEVEEPAPVDVTNPNDIGSWYVIEPTDTDTNEEEMESEPESEPEDITDNSEDDNDMYVEMSVDPTIHVNINSKTGCLELSDMFTITSIPFMTPYTYYDEVELQMDDETLVNHLLTIFREFVLPLAYPSAVVPAMGYFNVVKNRAHGSQSHYEFLTETGKGDEAIVIYRVDDRAIETWLSCCEILHNDGKLIHFIMDVYKMSMVGALNKLELVSDIAEPAFPIEMKSLYKEANIPVLGEIVSMCNQCDEVYDSVEDFIEENIYKTEDSYDYVIDDFKEAAGLVDSDSEDDEETIEDDGSELSITRAFAHHIGDSDDDEDEDDEEGDDEDDIDDAELDDEYDEDEDDEDGEDDGDDDFDIDDLPSPYKHHLRDAITNLNMMIRIFKDSMGSDFYEIEGNVRLTEVLKDMGCNIPLIKDSYRFFKKMMDDPFEKDWMIKRMRFITLNARHLIQNINSVVEMHCKDDYSDAPLIIDNIMRSFANTVARVLADIAAPAEIMHFAEMYYELSGVESDEKQLNAKLIMIHQMISAIRCDQKLTSRTPADVKIGRILEYAYVCGTHDYSPININIVKSFKNSDGASLTRMMESLGGAILESYNKSASSDMFKMYCMSVGYASWDIPEIYNNRRVLGKLALEFAAFIANDDKISRRINSIVRKVK